VKRPKPDTFFMTLHRRAPIALLLLALSALITPLCAAPLRFLPWDDVTAARPFGLKNGEQITELKNLHHLKRSDAVNATVEPAPLLLAMDRKNAEGNPEAIPIKVPAGVENPLVLIIPDPKHPTGVRPFVIEDNTARFKWGSIRILNATGKAVMMKVDKTVAQLPPAWTPVDIDPGGTPRNLGIQSAYKDNPAKILYSAVWEHDPDVRELVIVLPNQNSGVTALDCKIIPENRKVMEAEAAAAKQRE
jgi:hypothetical protein